MASREPPPPKRVAQSAVAGLPNWELHWQTLLVGAQTYGRPDVTALTSKAVWTYSCLLEED